MLCKLHFSQPHPNLNYIEIAAADTGCTLHYLKDHIVENKGKYIPINIQQLDGAFFLSKSSREIPILPELPKQARTAHSFTYIKKNLSSIRQFCDAGCTAVFDKRECKIKLDDKTVITVKRNKDKVL